MTFESEGFTYCFYLHMVATVFLITLVIVHLSGWLNQVDHCNQT